MVKEQRFYLIRHGESLGNIGLDAGYDPALSPNGHAQVKKCAAFIRDICTGTGVIYTSPLERCIITAEAIYRATDFPVKLEPDLHEYFSFNMVHSKKLKFETLTEKKDKFKFLILPAGYQDQWWPSAGEKPSDLELRISIFRNRLLREERDTDNIICIGHWCSVKALAEAFIPGVELKYVANAAVTSIVKKEDGSFELDFVNQTYHQF
jgi:broad specificity phosphatase PhoE